VFVTQFKIKEVMMKYFEGDKGEETVQNNYCAGGFFPILFLSFSLLPFLSPSVSLSLLVFLFLSLFLLLSLLFSFSPSPFLFLFLVQCFFLFLVLFLSFSLFVFFSLSLPISLLFPFSNFSENRIYIPLGKKIKK
jgi:hypothetical protein